MFLVHFTALHVLGRSNRKVPPDGLQSSFATNFNTEPILNRVDLAYEDHSNSKKKIYDQPQKVGLQFFTWRKRVSSATVQSNEVMAQGGLFFQDTPHCPFVKPS